MGSRLAAVRKLEGKRLWLVLGGNFVVGLGIFGSDGVVKEFFNVEVDSSYVRLLSEFIWFGLSGIFLVGLETVESVYGEFWRQVTRSLRGGMFSFTARWKDWVPMNRQASATRSGLPIMLKWLMSFVFFTFSALTISSVFEMVYRPLFKWKNLHPDR